MWYVVPLYTAFLLVINTERKTLGLIKANKVIKTIQQQTGFQRAHPSQLCQDLPTLLKVSEFSFNENPAFLKYLDRRGVA